MEVILLGAAAWVIYLLWQRVERLRLRVELLEGAPAPSIPGQHSVPPLHTHSPASLAQGAVEIPVSSAASPEETEPVPQTSRRSSEPPAADFIAADEPAITPEPVTARSDHWARWKPSLDIEDLFGRLLPIWAGGITLAVAGLFIVRYSIESGLLTPSVRVMLAMLFGLVLLGTAEAAFRFERRIADPRVRQALAGAGLATLYAGFYLAGSTYGLIGPFAAFAGLAAVTAGAIVLSYRFGMPSAVLGLVGGFAAPLLVGGEQGNIPLLAGYLALITAGLTATARHRRWAWLGLAALGGGLGWGVLLLLGFGGGTAETLAIGLLLAFVGVAIPASCMPDGGKLRRLVDTAAAAVAAVQMAVLINQAGHSLLAWGLFVLLGTALAVIGWNNSALRRASGFAALLVPLLLAIWPDPEGKAFTVVAVAFAAILAGVPAALVYTRRHGNADLPQLAAFTLALFTVTAWQFGAFDDTTQWPIGLVALALASFGAFAAWCLWPARSVHVGWDVLLLSATAAVLVAAGGLYVTPGWIAPVVGATVGFGLLLLGGSRGDRGLANLAWAGAAAVIGLLFLTGNFQDEVLRLVGEVAGVPDLAAALRWAMPAALLGTIARSDPRAHGKVVAEAGASAFIYGFAAQLLPSDALAWFCACAAGLALFALRGRISGATTLLVAAGLWAMLPLIDWSLAGLEALGGVPMLVSGLPSLRSVALELVPFALVLAALVWTARERLDLFRGWALILAGFAVVVPLHVTFKHLLALDSLADFQVAGLAERTLWQALLVGVSWAAFCMRDRFAGGKPIALALAAMAAAHWSWFTLMLHNPLLVPQYVGPVPIANLLLPVYGLPVAALVWSRDRLPDSVRQLRPAVDGVTMALISLFALSTLRQAFSGTDLTAIAMGEGEDLLRSITGILLAILFLLWGTWRDERTWRIGSLAVMVLAVLKVFLVDAAGLESLARIASFVALGFSLIGIGWFYARQLNRASSDDVATGFPSGSTGKGPR